MSNDSQTVILVFCRYSKDGRNFDEKANEGAESIAVSAIRVEIRALLEAQSYSAGMLLMPAQGALLRSNQTRRFRVIGSRRPRLHRKLLVCRVQVRC